MIAVSIVFIGMMLPILVPYLLVALLPSTTSHHTPSRTFTTEQKLSPAFWLGNEDDPMPPADYLIGDPDRIAKWYWRNPFHNFTFYVIGICDQELDRIGHRPDVVFNPDEGWNWTVCRAGWIALPFISYKNGKFQTYFGWRECGNFGIKLNF